MASAGRDRSQGCRIKTSATERTVGSRQAIACKISSCRAILASAGGDCSKGCRIKTRTTEHTVGSTGQARACAIRPSSTAAAGSCRGSTRSSRVQANTTKHTGTNCRGRVVSTLRAVEAGASRHSAQGSRVGTFSAALTRGIARRPRCRGKRAEDTFGTAAGCRSSRAGVVSASRAVQARGLRSSTGGGRVGAYTTLCASS